MDFSNAVDFDLEISEILFWEIIVAMEVFEALSSFKFWFLCWRSSMTSGFSTDSFTFRSLINV